jgi:streptogramin lyase
MTKHAEHAEGHTMSTIRHPLARAAIALLSACSLLGATAGCTSSTTSDPAAAPPSSPAQPTAVRSNEAEITSFRPNPSLPIRTIHARTGSAPSGIAVARHAVWVTEHRAHDVLRINPATARVVARIPIHVGSGNIEDAPTVTSNYVYLCVYGAQRLVRIDTKTNRVTGTLHVPCEGKGTGSLGTWIAGGDALRMIDPHRLRIARTFHLKGVPTDVGSDIAEAGGSVWLLYGTGLLLRVSPGTGEITAKWNFGAAGLITTDGRSIYVSNPEDDTIEAIDVGTNKVVRHGRVPGADEGDPIPTYGDGAVWLSTLDGGLARLDPQTMRIADSVQIDVQDYVGEVGVGFGKVWFPTYGGDSIVEISAAALAG